MKKWYEEKFVSHRDWVLDHLEVLGLNPQEALLVLLIDFCNEHEMEISEEVLSQKTGLSVSEVDTVISTLCAKKYLDIRASSKAIHFCLDGLYETEVARDASIMDSSLFDLFETQFGRTLSNREMEKISDWNRTMDRRLIIYALREASARQKKNLTYVESILNEWNQKGLTADMIAEGNVHDNTRSS